jgi:hypothetical protein
MYAYRRYSLTTESSSLLLTDYVSIPNLRFHAEQFRYLADQAIQRKLFIWPYSQRTELRSYKSVVDYLSYLNASYFEYLHHFSSVIRVQNYHLIASFEQNPSLYKNTPSFYNKQVYIRPFPSSASPLISGSVLDLDKIEVFGSLGLGRESILVLPRRFMKPRASSLSIIY